MTYATLHVVGSNNNLGDVDRLGYRIEHFTRVETPGDNPQSGSNHVQWVRVEVDSSDPEVFSFDHEVVELNRWPQYTP